MNEKLTLILLPETFAVCRLENTSPIPEWAYGGNFFSLTKTSCELSIVVHQLNVPSDVKCEKDWRALMIEGPLDFSLTGVLATLLVPLAEAKISIFSLSTFDTDYILIKEKHIQQALAVLSSFCVIKY